LDSRPTSLRTRRIAIAAVVVVAALALGVVYSATSRTNQSTDIATNTNSPCETAFPGGLETQKGDWSGLGGAGRQIVTFFLPTNSTGTVCVSYGTTASPQSALPNSTLFSGSVLSLNVTYDSGGYILNSEEPAEGVTVTTSMQYLTNSADGGNSTNSNSSANRASGGTTSITAVYTITASSTARGIFALGYPGECPPWIPIAIGYTKTAAQQAIDSAYPIFLEPSGCIDDNSAAAGITFGGDLAVGIGGSMQVGYVAASQAGT